MPKSRKTVAGIAAVTLGLGAAFAIAAVPDGEGVIHSCIEKAAGGGTLPTVAPNVRVIDTGGGQACDPASEFPLDWNQTGPTGAPGAPGAAGPQGPTGPAGPGGPAGADGTATVTREAPPQLLAGQVELTGITPFDVLSVSLRQRRGAAPEVLLRRELDQLSPKLMSATIKGTLFSTATIRIYSPGTTNVGATIKMTGVLISSFQTLQDGQKLVNDLTLVGKTLKATGTLVPAVQYQAPKKKGV